MQERVFKTPVHNTTRDNWPATAPHWSMVFDDRSHWSMDATTTSNVITSFRASAVGNRLFSQPCVHVRFQNHPKFTEVNNGWKMAWEKNLDFFTFKKTPQNLKSPKFRFSAFLFIFGQILYRSYLISYFNRDYVSFVIIYRRLCDRENIILGPICIGCSSWVGILCLVLFVH